MEKSPVATVSAWLLGLLVLYVLSIGPVIGLAERGMISPDGCEVIKVVYTPLEDLTDVPGVSTILLDYIYWWVPRHPSNA